MNVSTFEHVFMSSSIIILILEIITNRWQSVVVSHKSAALYLMGSVGKVELMGKHSAMKSFASVFVAAYSLGISNRLNAS